MRAMVARDKGAPLALEQRPTPEPGSNEALIEVEACGGADSLKAIRLLFAKQQRK
jgi:NADPH:quinone reductase-like Zn-dependent oxidoreductase